MEIRDVKGLIRKAKGYMDLNDGVLQEYPTPKSPFDYFYLFSNENLSFLFSRINVKGKSVLTVGSSGDQALYAFGNGAKNIVHFDVNPFSEVYFDYKVAAIRELEYKEFKRFFNNRKYPLLSDELYDRICHNLPLESRLFWDDLYRNGFGSGEYQLHKNDSGMINYNKADYYKIKNALSMGDPNIRFINSDLQTITEKLDPSEKFDYILLSNIYSYANQWKTDIPGEEVFRNSIDDLCNYLNPNGRMQIGYLWDDVASRASVMGYHLGLDNVYTIQTPIDEGSIMYAPDGVYNFSSSIFQDYTQE